MAKTIKIYPEMLNFKNDNAIIKMLKYLKECLKMSQKY